MTIARVKTAGWALNEKLTSAQMNAVDLNVTNALDKRAGQTDTLNSVVTVGSSGEIKFSSGAIETHLTGSASTYNSGSLISFNGTMTFDGDATHANGDISTFSSGSLISHASGSFDHYLSGAGMINDGYGEFADLRLSGTSKVTYTTTRTFTRKFLPQGDRDSKQINSVPGIIDLEVKAVGANFTLDLGKCGIPNGAIITKIKCYYEPALGHAFLPAQLPELKLYRSPFTTIAATVLETAYSLGIPDVAAYEVYQSIDTPTISIALDLDNYAYSVWFTTESGLNSDDGTIVFGFEVTFTTTAMNEY